jgi:DNA-binding Lrp family transcriptional regulator
MSAGLYLLARFSDHEKLLPAAKLLEGAKTVARWDAVDGHVHLVVRARSTAPLDSLKSLGGLEQSARFDISKDNDSGESFDPSLAHAYVFVETEPDKRDAVCQAVTALPEILFCSTTTGGCDLVAVIRGPRFSAIDSTIADKIRPLDGVVRLKHDRIIDLRQF